MTFHFLIQHSYNYQSTAPTEIKRTQAKLTLQEITLLHKDDTKLSDKCPDFIIVPSNKHVSIDQFTTRD